MMDRRLIWFVVSLLPVLAWSAIRPHDYFTWFLEVAPILIGVPVMLAVQRRFPLSTLLLVLLWLHCVVLIVGGHYTYARVPLGDWAMNCFGWSRNNYDKIGHFAQGFVPAILAREIFLRVSPLGTGGVGGHTSRWLPFLVGSECLAFSALYELIEWLTALGTGEAAEDFLGTQGDPWDTQTDMALALIGSVCALVRECTIALSSDSRADPWFREGVPVIGRSAHLTRLGWCLRAVTLYHSGSVRSTRELTTISTGELVKGKKSRVVLKSSSLTLARPAIGEISSPSFKITGLTTVFEENPLK